MKGVWAGIARALEPRLAGKREGSRRVMSEADVPRNAVLVVSVHVDDPAWGPATRDCLHHEPTRAAIAEHVAERFFSELAAARGESAAPPWQLLGGVHFSEHWLDVLAEILADPASAPADST